MELINQNAINRRKRQCPKHKRHSRKHKETLQNSLGNIAKSNY